jgi:hypothetical protein
MTSALIQEKELTAVKRHLANAKRELEDIRSSQLGRNCSGRKRRRN